MGLYGGVLHILTVEQTLLPLAPLPVTPFSGKGAFLFLPDYALAKSADVLAWNRFLKGSIFIEKNI